jgi:hypothetical protein
MLIIITTKNQLILFGYPVMVLTVTINNNKNSTRPLYAGFLLPEIFSLSKQLAIKQGVKQVSPCRQGCS